MKIKKLLLCVSALSGLLAANALMAAPPGAGTTIRAAKAVCMSTLTGDVPLYTVAGAGQQQGTESSWLIANNSNRYTLAITSIDSFDINGNLLVHVTPTSVAKPGVPAGATIPTLTGKLFTWNLAPHQVSRFPHDFAMLYRDDANRVVGTDPSLVRWHMVVISVSNATAPGTPISTPYITTGMVERGAYTVSPTILSNGTVDVTKPGGQAPVLTRTRNECVYQW